MTAAAFDTLAYARKLRDAGIDAQVAEAQAAALAEVLQQNVETLATKQDLSEIRRDLEKLELRLESRIETIKSDLLKWVIGLLLAQIAIIAALVKLF